MPAYRISMSAGEMSRTTKTIHGTIEGLPLAPRSSKSLATQTLFDVDASDVVGVRQRRGSELLDGELINPLPVDLLDGMLVYKNWVYLLPTRLPSGRVDSFTG